MNNMQFYRIVVARHKEFKVILLYISSEICRKYLYNNIAQDNELEIFYSWKKVT